MTIKNLKCFGIEAGEIIFTPKTFTILMTFVFLLAVGIAAILL